MRTLAALGAFVGTIVAVVPAMAVLLAVVRLWLEGNGKPSWLFTEQSKFLGFASPADLLLVVGSVAAGLIVALLVWRLLGER